MHVAWTDLQERFSCILRWLLYSASATDRKQACIERRMVLSVVQILVRTRLMVFVSIWIPAYRFPILSSHVGFKNVASLGSGRYELRELVGWSNGQVDHYYLNSDAALLVAYPRHL